MHVSHWDAWLRRPASLPTFLLRSPTIHTVGLRVGLTARNLWVLPNEGGGRGPRACSPTILSVIFRVIELPSGTPLMSRFAGRGGPARMQAKGVALWKTVTQGTQPIQTLPP